MEKEKVKGIPYGVASFEQLRSCFEFLQKVFLGLMYPFSCVLWAIFWSFPLLSSSSQKRKSLKNSSQIIAR